MGSAGAVADVSEVAGAGRRVVLPGTGAGHRAVHDKRGARAGQVAAALRDRFSGDEPGQLKAAAALPGRLAERL